MRRRSGWRDTPHRRKGPLLPLRDPVARRSTVRSLRVIESMSSQATSQPGSIGGDERAHLAKCQQDERDVELRPGDQTSAPLAPAAEPKVVGPCSIGHSPSGLPTMPLDPARNRLRRLLGAGSQVLTGGLTGRCEPATRTTRRPSQNLGKCRWSEAQSSRSGCRSRPTSTPS